MDAEKTKEAFLSVPRLWFTHAEALLAIASGAKWSGFREASLLGPLGLLGRLGWLGAAEARSSDKLNKLNITTEERKAFDTQDRLNFMVQVHLLYSYIYI